MTFETISLLLNWMEMGALLAILFRLSSTFELIASTQRELRRAIHHLGDRRAPEIGIENRFSRPELGFAFDSRPAPPDTSSTRNAAEPAPLSPWSR